MDNGFEVFEYPDYEEKDVQSAEKDSTVNKTEIVKIIICIAILLVCSVNLFFTVNMYLLQTDYAQVKPIIFQDSNLGVADKNNIVVDVPENKDENNAAETTGVSQDNINIIISQEDEKTTEATTAEQTINKININTASTKELMELKGIGEKKAQSIIDYRNENGRFEKIEDITDVSGIGEKTLENIRDMISVD